MPLPTNNSRPSLPYTPDQSLPNNQRFDLLGKRPPTAQMLDAEFNALTDDINMLAAGINDVQAGNIPGSDDPLNANKVLKTDGQVTLSFTLINSAQLSPNSIVEAALSPQSVTTPKDWGWIHHQRQARGRICTDSAYSSLCRGDR